jgi:hypothetical protein
VDVLSVADSTAARTLITKKWSYAVAIVNALDKFTCKYKRHMLAEGIFNPVSGFF